MSNNCQDIRKQDFISAFSRYFRVQEVKDMADRLEQIGFFFAPASTKYHGNHPGGLYEHSCNVAEQLLRLTNSLNLKWERDASPLIVGFFHDLCKCDSYEDDYNGNFIYSNDMLIKGHGIKSVAIASTIMQLTEEAVACICYHMGAFCDKSEWNDFTNAIHKYNNVLFTHTADMIAAHIKEVE